MNSTALTITTGVSAAVAFLAAVLLILSPSSVAESGSVSAVLTTSVPASDPGDDPVHEGQNPELPGQPPTSQFPEISAPETAGGAAGAGSGAGRPETRESRQSRVTEPNGPRAPGVGR